MREIGVVETVVLMAAVVLFIVVMNILNKLFDDKMGRK